MRVTFIVHFKLAAEAVEQFAHSLPEVARELASVEGCDGVRAYRSESSPDAFTLVERWASKAAHQAHMQRVTDSGRWQQLLDQLAEPPNAGYFTELGSFEGG